MKKSAMLVAAILAFALCKANAGVPSGTAAVSDRGAPLDGNGTHYDNAAYLGYKVFIATSATATPLLDNNGNVVPNGQLHMVCTSSGAATTENVVVFDSNTISGISITSVNQMIMPPLNRSATAQTCSPSLDAQFNTGLIILNSVNSGQSTVYWRPSGGGRQ